MKDNQGRPRPALRKDLRISRQSYGGEVGFVVKDPLKNKYYRFTLPEWQIIQLFDGTGTLEELVKKFNDAHRDVELDLDTLAKYRSDLDSMNLLEKTTKDRNVMLVEKMKELRQSQLLSIKGSLFYKRFPLVDPDRFFNQVIPYLKFIWTWQFLIFSLAVIVTGSFFILSRWTEFKEGVYTLASFQHISVIQLATLWITVYAVIAIHELGHGLTCKHFGGEVHEIGFLLLFFQPCLYCNVNDAWLLDKKWKQVLVSLAGGYVEYLIASFAAIIWAFTAPGTDINVLCFQVMSVGSISTVVFNLNPLIKLDGYYLLADFLGTPNLRERSFSYLKYLASKYVFRLKPEPFEANRREQRIFFVFGVVAGLWTTSVMFGLLYMIRNLAGQFFPQITLIATLIGIHKFFGAQIKKAALFLCKWYQQKRVLLLDPTWRKRLVYGTGGILLILFLPFPYTISGRCVLEPSFTRVIRSASNGTIQSFLKHDGETVTPLIPLIFTVL